MAIPINRTLGKTRTLFSLVKKHPWLHRFLGETRTRILLLHVITMLLVAAASVPIFLAMLYASVDERVHRALNQEMQEFLNAYRLWEEESSQTETEFRQFLDDYLAQQLPEDDNFLIAIVDNKLYRSNPAILPELLKPGSSLSERWMYTGRPIAGKEDISASDVDDVLYIAQPLVLQQQIRGVFVVVHQTVGERQQAWEVSGIFIRVAIGVVIISSVLTWLATAQLLAPVKQLASAARSVSESDLSQRIPPIKGSGEMAELAETFNAMMNRLQDAFMSQRNFINDAGHELRTPVTIIQGHLELMGDDPHEQQETLELVMDELGRMSRMINDMILLAKAERPDFLHLESIDIPSFTEELFVKSQALADRKWQLKILSKGEMLGDRQRLTGALLNLTQNAVHHTQPGQLIELGSIVERKEVRFWVRDAGEGIPLDDQKRIFERFARTANSYRRSDGAGLGLAIVRAITEAHGGHVELISQPGVGSTFAMVLPLKPTKRLFR